MKNYLITLSFIGVLFVSGKLLASNSCDISVDGMVINSTGAWTTGTGGSITNSSGVPKNYCYSISQSGGFSSTSIVVKVNLISYAPGVTFVVPFGTVSFEVLGTVPGSATCGAQNNITISVHITGACSSSECAAALTIKKPLASITGPTSVCNGAANVPYSINYPLSAGTVSWTATNAWQIGGSPGTSITLTPVTGISTSLCATSSAFCNSPCLTVYKGVHFTDAPTPFCEWDIDSWSIAPVSGATSYTWSFTAMGSGATPDGLDITGFGTGCNIEAMHYGSYKVKCTANGCSTATWGQLTLFVNQTGHGGCAVRIQANEDLGSKSKVEVVPNPASSFVNFNFTLSSGDALLWMEIKDVAGRTMRHASFDSQSDGNDFSINQDVSDLTPGIYYYAIKTKHENFVGKILIQ